MAPPVEWIVTDPDVLDCPICFDPLTVPVFQCQEGHIVCSLCITRLNICPSCRLPIGDIRCKAIEKVLESVKVTCPNIGCNETMSYSMMNDHVQTCPHMPASSE